MANQKRKCLLRSSEKKANKTCLTYFFELGASVVKRNLRLRNKLSLSKSYLLHVNLFWNDHMHFCQLHYLIDSVIQRSPDACFKNFFGNYFLHIWYARSTLLFKTPQELCMSQERGTWPIDWPDSLTWLYLTKHSVLILRKKGWKSNKLKNSSSYRY